MFQALKQQSVSRLEGVHGVRRTAHHIDIILLHELQEQKIEDMAVMAIQKQDMGPWDLLRQLLDKPLAPLQKKLGVYPAIF